eukprot:767363-Hanusia_phi.AAC.3
MAPGGGGRRRSSVASRPSHRHSLPTLASRSSFPSSSRSRTSLRTPTPPLHPLSGDQTGTTNGRAVTPLVLSSLQGTSGSGQASLWTNKRQKNAVEKSMILDILSRGRGRLLNALSKSDLNKLVEVSEIVDFNKDAHIVAEEGEVLTDEMLVLMQGCVAGELKRHGSQSTARFQTRAPGACFGLLENENATLRLVAASDVRMCRISWEDLSSLFLSKSEAKLVVDKSQRELALRTVQRRGSPFNYLTQMETLRLAERCSISWFHAGEVVYKLPQTSSNDEFVVFVLVAGAVSVEPYPKRNLKVNTYFVVDTPGKLIGCTKKIGEMENLDKIVATGESCVCTMTLKALDEFLHVRGSKDFNYVSEIRLNTSKMTEVVLTDMLVSQRITFFALWEEADAALKSSMQHLHEFQLSKASAMDPRLHITPALDLSENAMNDFSKILSMFSSDFLVDGIDLEDIKIRLLSILSLQTQLAELLPSGMVKTDTTRKLQVAARILNDRESYVTELQSKGNPTDFGSLADVTEVLENLPSKILKMEEAIEKYRNSLLQRVPRGQGQKMFENLMIWHERKGKVWALTRELTSKQASLYPLVSRIEELLEEGGLAESNLELYYSLSSVREEAQALKTSLRLRLFVLDWSMLQTFIFNVPDSADSLGSPDVSPFVTHLQKVLLSPVC